MPALQSLCHQGNAARPRVANSCVKLHSSVHQLAAPITGPQLIHCAGQGTTVVAADVMWSDPSAEPGLQMNDSRGVGVVFGADVTEVRRRCGVRLVFPDNLATVGRQDALLCCAMLALIGIDLCRPWT